MAKASAIKDKNAAGMRFKPGPAGGYGFDAAEAIAKLSSADGTMGRLIEAVGSFRLELDELISPFEALAESIVYQQLTGKAAATIFGRVKEIFGSERLPSADKILATSDEALRKAGLSGAKTAAFKDLAAKQQAGCIPTLDELQALTDEEIVEKLVQVRGIGRWTAEMLLIFKLGRPDVLPIHDYGVRKGFARTYRKKELPTPSQLAKHGEKWRPFRTVASWYLWRSLELP